MLFPSDGQNLISSCSAFRIKDGQSEYFRGLDGKPTKLAIDSTAAALTVPHLKTETTKSISPSLGMGPRTRGPAGLHCLLPGRHSVDYQLPAAGAIDGIPLTVRLSCCCFHHRFFFRVSPLTLTAAGLRGIILSRHGQWTRYYPAGASLRKSNGRTIDGAIDLGYNRAFTAIFDGNVTVIIVAIILMGAFGPPDSLFARMLAKVFFMFGPTTAGTIYSFGYTLLVGVILNLLMGVLMSRLMLKSISRYSAFRKPVLYGGEKA
jgi:hypothetical protein